MSAPGSDRPPRKNPPLKNQLEELRAKLGASLPRGPEPAAKSEPPVRVSEERLTVRQERAGRGGKTVTIAEGPAFAGRDLAKLAGGAARALGLGARVEGATLVLQGDQRERLAAWLAQQGFARVERGN